MRIGEDHIRQEIEKTLDELEIRGGQQRETDGILRPGEAGGREPFRRSGADGFWQAGGPEEKPDGQPE